MSKKVAAARRMTFVAIDDTSDRPLYEQVYLGLRDHIVRGNLGPGSRVPSSRRLARELGVSRFTIVTAFEMLAAEGYVHGSTRGGTFVSPTLPDKSVRIAAKNTLGARKLRAPAQTSRPARDLSARGEVIASLAITGPRHPDHLPRPFHPRRPPLDLFPAGLWSRLVRRQWRERPHELLDYGDPAGSLGLRTAIAEHAGVTRGVQCTPEQVVITAGAQQAFGLIFTVLLEPGDRAWIEEPGYLDARAALLAAGARVVPVPVDSEGLSVASGMTIAADARLAYVSPSHQYPTGVTMSASRRMELLAWAREHDAWIVEDDYDSYFRYRGRPLPALQSVEADLLAAEGAREGGRVVYVGTFSKTMFPSLRLGYCIVPARLAAPIARGRAIADRNSSLSDQAALEAFIREGHYDRHLRRVRSACLERYERVVKAVERELGDVVSLSRMNAGTHVVATVAKGYPTALTIERRAADAGLVVFPLSRYCMTPPRRDRLILGYGAVPPREIDGAVRRLARIVRA